MHRLVTTTPALIELCNCLQSNKFVTVDTEFIREKTYYSQLCLIQIAGEGIEAAVDPLAEGIDLTPLLDLMRNPDILKVFHAAKQDLEIFHQLMKGELPAPLHDTQISAMVCGHGEQVGYEALVNKLLGGTLDKVSRYTDWAQRPLSQRQLDYAIADVTHLRDIYQKLSDQLAQQGRTEWIAEEMAILNDPSRYVVNPQSVWKKLKYKNRTSAYLARLQAVAAWRETTAQQRNIPRGRLLKDEIILQIAAMNPKTIDELEQVRGALKHLNKAHCTALLDALEAARQLPRDQQPTDTKKKSPLTPKQDALVDVLKLLLKLQCDEQNVASKLVANKDDLADLVLTPDDPALRCTHGWRYDIFGRHAQDFIEGRLQLVAEPNSAGICFQRSSDDTTDCKTGT